MNWLAKIKRNPIVFFLYFILFFIAVNALMEFYHRAAQEEYQIVVKKAARADEWTKGLLLALHDMEIGFRGYYMVPNDQLLSPFKIGVENYRNNVAELEYALEQQGISQKNLNSVKKTYENYISLLTEMMRWKDAGNTAAIDSVMLLDPGYDTWKAYDQFSKDLQKAEDVLLGQSQAKMDQAVWIATLVKFSLFLLGIPILILTIIRLVQERRRRVRLFAELDKNNKELLFNPLEEEQELDEKVVSNSLISNLRKATEFITQISRGNYELSWDGLTDKNREANRENLSGALLLMRQQMIKVRQEDQVRLWTTEGISKFSEIVRQHQDNVGLLSDKITSEIVKYLGANQASLFFVVEKEPKLMVLEQKSCYAYDRKKYLEKTIHAGEGLVGQTYLEKEIVYLTDIPQDYVRISSGLGEARPTSLILVPLKFNQRVEGVLEMASFNEIQPYEMEFLKRVGEILASAIVSIRSSIEMKKLMEEMQHQSEGMRAQEEEMRQNVEELQATQEEMERKVQEYQALMEEKDMEMKRVKKQNAELKARLKVV